MTALIAQIKVNIRANIEIWQKLCFKETCLKAIKTYQVNKNVWKPGIKKMYNHQPATGVHSLPRMGSSQNLQDQHETRREDPNIATSAQNHAERAILCNEQMRSNKTNKYAIIAYIIVYLASPVNFRWIIIVDEVIG